MLDSGELQRRLDLDPVLNNVSILGVDPGFMTTGIARHHESWFVRNVIHGLLMIVVVRLLSWIRPSGLFRTEEKSAGHILAAAFSSDAPFSQRPKALHLDRLQLKEPSAESKDPRKRMTLWKDRVRYAHVLSDFELSFVEESKVVKKSYMWRDAMKGQHCRPRPGEQS